MEALPISYFPYVDVLKPKVNRFDGLAASKRRVHEIAKFALADAVMRRYRTMQVLYINKSLLYVSIPNADVMFHRRAMALETQAMTGARDPSGPRTD